MPAPEGAAVDHRDGDACAPVEETTVPHGSVGGRRPAGAWSASGRRRSCGRRSRGPYQVATAGLVDRDRRAVVGLRGADARRRVLGTARIGKRPMWSVCQRATKSPSASAVALGLGDPRRRRCRRWMATRAWPGARRAAERAASGRAARASARRGCRSGPRVGGAAGRRRRQRARGAGPCSSSGRGQRTDARGGSHVVVVSGLRGELTGSRSADALPGGTASRFAPADPDDGPQWFPRPPRAGHAKARRDAPER